MTNSYNPTKWVEYKTVATANVMNNIEKGIVDAHEKLSEVDSQIKDREEYIKLSSLGLGDDGIENLNIILNNLNNNYTNFIVDGNYYISTNITHDLNYDFNLISYNEGSLIFNSNSDETFFNLKSNVNLKNVSFLNQSDNVKIIFTTLEDNGAKIGHINIEGCKFQGNMRVCDLSTCNEVTKINVVNNTILNTKNSFFQTSSFKINNVVIRGNYARNWFYRLFSITNFENVENMIVSDNTATNDDDWIFNEIVDDNTYYTFALIKAKKIVYTNNLVENMKSVNDIALYDCYAFADYYVYENNVFKNNICFDTNRINALMKCKNENSIKLFRNNNFIIEESFLTKNGVTASNFKVKLYDIWGGYQDEVHALPVEFTITDNKITVPNLKLEKGYRFVSNFIFANNYIKCGCLSDGLVVSKYENSNIKVINNTFENSSNSNFSLIRGKTDSTAKFKRVEVTNNSFNSIKYILESLETSFCNISNNTITDPDTNNTLTLNTYVNANRLVCCNNIILNSYGVADHNNISIYNMMVSENTGVISESYIYLHNLNLSSNKNITISILYSNKQDIFEVSVYEQDGVKKVDFVDKNGSSRSFEIQTTNGHGVSVQNKGNGNAVLLFHNKANTTRLSLTTNNNSISNVKICIN